MAVCSRRLLPFLAVLLLVVGTYILGGCASTSPPTPTPDVRPALDTTWALVPLRATGPSSADEGVTSYHSHLTSVAARELTWLGQEAVQYRKGESDTAGVSPSRLYRSAGEEGPRPLNYEALSVIAQSTEVRYVLVGQAVRWDRSLFAGGVEVDVGFAPSGGLGVGIGPGATKGLSVHLALVDVSAQNTVWRSSRQFTGMLESTVAPFGTDERTIELYTRSMVLELVTGRELPAESFTLDTDDNVIVYRYDQPSVVGRAARVEEGEVVVETQDGTTARYPIPTVSSIKSTTQNKRIFPATDVR